jgi:hypothetical protein
LGQLRGQDAEQGHGHKAPPTERASRLHGYTQYRGADQSYRLLSAHLLLKNGTEQNRVFSQKFGRQASYPQIFSIMALRTSS